MTQLLPILLRYLGSRRHIVGCVLAVLSPVLLFLQVIDQGWLWITLGLYVSGALLTPHRPAPTLPSLPPVEPVTLAQGLQHLQQQLQHHHNSLPPEAVERLTHIYQLINDMAQPNQARAGVDERLFALDDIVQRYIPEMLTQYLKLPQRFRAEHVLKGGQTAQALLLEQLRLLDGEVEQLSIAIAENDAARLAEFSQFLQQRFAKAPEWDEHGQLKP
jgi:hypothetical protein